MPPKSKKWTAKEEDEIVDAYKSGYTTPARLKKYLDWNIDTSVIKSKLYSLMKGPDARIVKGPREFNLNHCSMY